MRSPRFQCAFSLIEVVVTLAIVAGSIVVILGLLSQLAKQSAQSEDTQTALRLPDAVAAELRALIVQRGFDAVAASAAVMPAGADEGLLLVAARDGTQLRPLAAGESPLREQYFLIQIRRFPSAPLAYTASAAAIPVNVRVSWPYRVLTPAGLTAVVSPADRHSVNFNLGLHR
jgi:hypothetical protein